MNKLKLPAFQPTKVPSAKFSCFLVCNALIAVNISGPKPGQKIGGGGSCQCNTMSAAEQRSFEPLLRTGLGSIEVNME